MGLFSNNILVQFNEDSTVFKSESSEVTLKNVMFLSDDGKDIVLSIGTDNFTKPSSKRTLILDMNNSKIEGILQSFILFGIQQVNSFPKILIGPNLSIKCGNVKHSSTLKTHLQSSLKTMRIAFKFED